ncbi:E3 ubiquitin-protein ligase ORTHRUS 2 [Ananas comosus]|uniref:RING-type E3 ubiquitin transferase n=1 Tax=Ananas comosus TaxID=4615 RepID=A0A6P5GPU5_ANACO|nr:E3 ubiquitin-protein ligase ORTHRUS 2 [Ananas comosus]
MATDLPCDGDGVCMVCRARPPEGEALTCRTCATPWHVPCLSAPPQTLAAAADWLCPDCSAPAAASPAAAAAPAGGAAAAGLIASIRAIEADASLTEQEKARRRQILIGGAAADDDDEEDDDDDEDDDDGDANRKMKKKKKKGKGGADDVLDLLDEKFNCSFCMQLPERPVTTPCGHNFCLKCFQKWVGQGKLTCAKCRSSIPAKMASQPRINSALVVAIRMAKTAKSNNSNGPTHVYHFMRNENRPDKAFTTERAKKAGKANACSGQIFVTVPPDHFGPILAENDPKRNRGVLVGELWEDRMECRQWGAHLPHVAGIAGQSDYGAQSVALSGGYEDDEDHGEWFLYTGSGGRDLSGNKRTNKEQSFDQKFEKLNQALRVSCLKGYPVRVVRSHKEKRSSYAPESGVRYDGIYRIEKCWRKVGIQGFKVCRYLFVRCDNEPAPWTSEEHGDRPRPLPAIKELKNATDITVRKETPAWDFDEKERWKWMKPPPVSRKPVITGKPEDGKRARKAQRLAQNLSVRERLLKEFSCLICRKVMTSPLTTPCAHNFCKTCLLGVFANQSFVRERSREGGRTLRAQKIAMKCPACPNDISDFLQNPQVNREMMDLIESLQRKTEEENVEEQQQSEEGGSDGEEKSAEDEDNIAEEKQPAEGESKNTEADADIETTDSVNEKSFPKTNLESGKGEATKEPNEVSGRGSPIVCFKRKKALAAGPSGKKRPKTCEFRNISAEDSTLADKKPDEDADNSETVNNGEETKAEAVNAESPSSPFSVPADDDSSQ